MTELPTWLSDDKPEEKTPASYLLKADSRDLTRWRAGAAATGHASFASFARAALDAATTSSTLPSQSSGGEIAITTDMLLISRSCYRGAHKTCEAGGCQCECH